MSGPARGVWAGLTFLCGFALVLWGAAAAASSLQGPRVQLMRELDALRRGADAPVLLPDRHLGQLANRHAQALAAGSALARASGARDLERSARGDGWRGAGPLLELRLRAEHPIAALRARIAEGGPEAAVLERGRTRVGVGFAAARDGSRIAVVLLSAPE